MAQDNIGDELSNDPDPALDVVCKVESVYFTDSYKSLFAQVPHCLKKTFHGGQNIITSEIISFIDDIDLNNYNNDVIECIIDIIVNVKNTTKSYWHILLQKNYCSSDPKFVIHLEHDLSKLVSPIVPSFYTDIGNAIIQKVN